MTTLDTPLTAPEAAERPARYKGRRRARWYRNRPAIWFGTGILAAALGLACGAAPNDVPDPGVPGVVERSAPAKAPKAKPTAKSWGDGDYEVGKDIQPGEYATRAGDDVIACTWTRVKDFSGSANSYIAVDIVDQGANGRMVVKKADYGVSFSGGCHWTVVK